MEIAAPLRDREQAVECGERLGFQARFVRLLRRRTETQELEVWERVRDSAECIVVRATEVVPMVLEPESTQPCELQQSGEISEAEVRITQGVPAPR